LSALRRYRDSD